MHITSSGQAVDSAPLSTGTPDNTTFTNNGTTSKDVEADIIIILGIIGPALILLVCLGVCMCTRSRCAKKRAQYQDAVQNEDPQPKKLTRPNNVKFNLMTPNVPDVPNVLQHNTAQISTIPVTQGRLSDTSMVIQIEDPYDGEINFPDREIGALKVSFGRSSKQGSKNKVKRTHDKHEVLIHKETNRPKPNEREKLQEAEAISSPTSPGSLRKELSQMHINNDFSEDNGSEIPNKHSKPKTPKTTITQESKTQQNSERLEKIAHEEASKVMQASINPSTSGFSTHAKNNTAMKDLLKTIIQDSGSDGINQRYNTTETKGHKIQFSKFQGIQNKLKHLPSDTSKTASCDIPPHDDGTIFSIDKNSEEYAISNDIPSGNQAMPQGQFPQTYEIGIDNHKPDIPCNTVNFSSALEKPDHISIAGGSSTSEHIIIEDDDIYSSESIKRTVKNVEYSFISSPAHKEILSSRGLAELDLPGNSIHIYSSIDDKTLTKTTGSDEDIYSSIKGQNVMEANGNDEDIYSSMKRENAMMKTNGSDEDIYSSAKRQNAMKTNGNYEDIYSSTEGENDMKTYGSDEDIYSSMKRQNTMETNGNDEDIYSSTEGENARKTNGNDEDIYSSTEGENARKTNGNDEDMHSSINGQKAMKTNGSDEDIYSSMKRQNVMEPNGNNDDIYSSIK